LTNRSPLFSGILIGGEKTINCLKSNSKSTNFKDTIQWNLGLRNPYYDKKVIEGEFEEDNTFALITRTPAIYNELHYLSTYKIKKIATGDDGTATEDVPFTSAMQGSSKIVTEAADSVVYDPIWLGTYLGFNYAINHNEVDFSGVNKEGKAETLNTIKFVLGEAQGNRGYFEELIFNGELQSFNGVIDDAYYYDVNEKYNEDDEFFSMLVHFINTGKGGTIRPVLLVDDLFKPNSKISSTEGDGEEENIASISSFITNTKRSLSMVYDIVTAECLTANDVIVEDLESEVAKNIVKVKFNVKTAEKQYHIVFDFSPTCGSMDALKCSTYYPNSRLNGQSNGVKLYYTAFMLIEA